MATPEAQDSPAPNEVSPSSAERVPMGQKVAYGMGSFIDMWGNWLYVGMVWPVFGFYFHVSSSLIGLALMLNRLFDAFSDPLFGWWSDNCRTRWGRRRPFILVGSILAGIGLPLLFAVPRDWSEMQYFWWMVGSSALYITIVSCVMMPYNSLGYEMTPNYHERTQIFAIKGAIQKMPEVAMFFASAFVTWSIWQDADTGETDYLRGAQIYTTILGAIMIVVGIFIFKATRERYYEGVVAQKQQKTKVAETLWQSIRCKPFRAILAMAFAYGMGTSMVGTLGYHCTIYYVCSGDQSVGSQWNGYMGLMGMVMGLSGVPVFGWISHRIGKRGAMKIVQFSAIAVFVSTWWLYTPEIVWLQMLATGLIAFTGAGFHMLDGSMMADVLDADELETGKRREGAFAACRSWILKVGMAAGIGLSGVILDATGFDSELQIQSAETLFNIRFYLAAIPIVGLIVALFALYRFNLTPVRMAEIRAALEARRGTV
ncbi:MFS transporter [Synoicihabitans lomoniglobus]|uniref:MFS transporter n=1 Tax=Synoicihabitans lomoniglobus TaxID=2909285 RepID=A0AAF0CHE8_9BACT|nr:MFS transporter [Opitutaceae bacterium LMO-M01]WED64232.1 MFS transporter [Opitutaceae bacterium LMO-M01]